MVNDGSTDDSGRLCDEIIRQDSRFRHIFQPNSGVSAARNRGMKEAKGELITFIDADDEIPAAYLAQLYRSLVENNAQIAVCDVAIIAETEEINRFTCEIAVFSQKQALNQLLTRRGINSGPCAKLFRWEVLDELTFPALKTYEDILFVMEAFCRCNCIAVTNQTEYRYIQNCNSAMEQMCRMPSDDIIIATSRLIQFLKAHPELDPTCFYITVSHLMQYVQLLVGNRTEEAKIFVSSARHLIREHLLQIVNCPAFPKKEKVVYGLFSLGWMYRKKKFTKL